MGWFCRFGGASRTGVVGVFCYACLCPAAAGLRQGPSPRQTARCPADLYAPPPCQAAARVFRDAARGPCRCLPLAAAWRSHGTAAPNLAVSCRPA